MLNLYAQPDPIKWGKIDKEDLQMSVYAEDSSASAVVLADYGHAYFTYDNDKGFRLNLERITRIKILNKNGLEHADQQIVLYHRGSNKEEISIVKGVTYNLKGKKVEKSKLDRDQVFREKHSDNLDVLKFTMPNVKEGSVIEFRYTLRTDFIYNFFTWEFQREIPVRWSEFRAKVPEYFHYKSFLSGYLPVNIVESNQYKDSFYWSQRGLSSSRTGGIQKSSGRVEPLGTRYRWAMENVPGLREEAFVTTMRDYMAKLDFELSYTKFPGSAIKYFSNSWEKLNEEFVKDARFGKQLSNARYLKDVLPGIVTGAEEDLEKMTRITHYVKNNFHYNDKKRVYTENNLKKVFDAKEGNSADLNLLLVMMLREAGLQAYPVILSTRDHGRINPVVPMEKDFNYVVAYVKYGDQTILLDGTDPALPFNMLPFYCLNQQGRLISEEFTTWVPLLQGEMIKEAAQADLSLSADGVFTGQLSLKHSGYGASMNRMSYIEDGEKEYLEETYGDKGWQIKEYTIENPETPSSDLSESIKLSIPQQVTVAGDLMYFQPLLLNVKKENPFKLDVRNFPVDFGCPRENMGMIKIKLPEGYEVEELPEQLAMSLPDQSGIFRYSVTQIGNELMVMNSLKISKPLYLPEEYLALKKFYELVVSKHAEQVVLKKVN